MKIRSLVVMMMAGAMVCSSVPVNLYASENYSEDTGDVRPAEAAQEDTSATAGMSLEDDQSDPVQIVSSGTCGDNLTWTLDGEGVLTISGTGEMTDYDAGNTYQEDGIYSDAPWWNERNSITDVTIEAGVTCIGDSSFYDCNNLTAVNIGDNVKSIGFQSFYGCRGLKGLVLPDNIDSIGGWAFGLCTSLSDVYFGGGEADWNSISFGTDVLNELKNVTIHYNYMKSEALSAVTVQLSKTKLTYNGKTQKPTLTVKDGDKELTTSSYTAAWPQESKNAGTYTVTVSLKGSYSGTKTVTYTIKPKDSSAVTVKLSKTKLTYNGKTRKPKLTIKDGKKKLTASSYTVTWPEKSVNAGTYTVKVRLKGNYSGTKKAKYTIKPKASSAVTVKLSKTKLTYNGKTCRPKLTIKDGKKKLSASCYTVAWPKKSVNPGQYTVTVKLKGNYSGTKKAAYTIRPKGTSISKLIAGTKQLTVNWKKQTKQTTGYEISYSTDKRFKNAKTVTVKGEKKTSTKIKKLKKGKTYYVRIRTYKTSGGKKYYSSWSKAKKAKVTK